MALLTLPPVLTLQLLRFVYDLATGSKKKVNAPVRFPAKIDLSTMTQVGTSLTFATWTYTYTNS